MWWLLTAILAASQRASQQSDDEETFADNPVNEAQPDPFLDEDLTTSYTLEEGDEPSQRDEFDEIRDSDDVTLDTDLNEDDLEEEIESGDFVVGSEEYTPPEVAIFVETHIADEEVTDPVEVEDAAVAEEDVEGSEEYDVEVDSTGVETEDTVSLIEEADDTFDFNITFEDNDADDVIDLPEEAIDAFEVDQDYGVDEDMEFVVTDTLDDSFADFIFEIDEDYDDTSIITLSAASEADSFEFGL